MQVESFKVFRDLVETQSFSKAAQLNAVTQSAVSQQVRAMEERFGIPLIERTSKKFGLTREGQMLYQTSRHMIQLYEGLQHQFQELRGVISGTIRVATVYSIGLHELPPYLKAFLKEYPQVNVHVEYRRSNQVYEDILQGTVDIGLVAFPAQRKNIKMEPFRKDKLVLICSPDNPLGKGVGVRMSEVAKAKFIAFESDIPTRRAVDRIFRERGLEVKPVMEFDNVETVKRAVEIDAGVSIVPRTTVEQELRNGTLKVIEMSGGDFHRPLGILYRNGRILSPALKKFLETLRKKQEAAS
ncbi:MAG TPA: LysR family transcriptional regulator [Verrucomicrobiae bacterium]|nr:LysR family transcriptional regulator [Verrucomicrobiae bacterium]